MKRYLVFSIIFLMSFIGIIQAETYKPGDIITYKDIKFYVVSDEGDYLTLLKATPLTVDEVNTYGKGYINKYTYSSQGTSFDSTLFGNKYKGYGGVAYYTSDTCGYKDDKYIYNECKDNYNDSDIKHIVDNWTEKVLDVNDLKEVEINNTKYKSRLITINDVRNMEGVKVGEWKITSYPIDFGYLSSRISFYSSWTMTPHEDSDYEMLDLSNVLQDKAVYNLSYVRPIIHLKKNTKFTSEIGTRKKAITDTEFITGDTVEYNGSEYYVLKNASNSDKTLTMIKKVSLTKEEIQKYNSSYDSDSISYYSNDKCTSEINGNLGYNNYSGCTNDYEKSNIKPIVDAWVKEEFKDEDLAVDELGYKARLITIDELKNNLFYKEKEPNITPITNQEIYEPSNQTPFIIGSGWTMSPVLDTNHMLYLSNGYVSIVSDHGQTGVGYRKIYPVVTIKKNVKNNVADNNYNNKVSVPNTLLKNPIFIVVVGIILIVIATITVSIILKRKK